MAPVLLRGCRQKILLSFSVLQFVAASLFSQATEIDYNLYYRFPLSLGAEYQSLSPFTDFGAQYNIFDLSLNARYPLPALPALQPVLKLGLMRFDSQDPEEPNKWDHSLWYGAFGMIYSHRFARTFEVGAEAAIGLSEALFTDLLPEEGTLGSLNLLLELGGRIALNPSYNFSLDVHPGIKYLYSLSPLKDFDGFIFAIGFGAAYRFGQDPDAPTAEIRSIHFDKLTVPALFAAMQSYYAKNPMGTVSISNTEKHPIRDIEVSFFQAGYMDSPTPAVSIPELAAGESRDIALLASFNEGVFKTEGITPLTGEVIVRYTSLGHPAEQHQSVSYDLYDKTAVTWNDDRKVAAFITPSDSALRNYASFIRQTCREEVIPCYNSALQTAMQVFLALSELGCLYQADPTLPFTRVQGNPLVVDSINLPRDTLSRITGDCDDLTVLYCSLLEAVGIETSFITVPGHIYAAFNTGVPSRDYREIHPERTAALNVDGNIWIPVEITLIGKTGFLDAWRKGVEQWRTYENSPELRNFHLTRKAQEIYRPVGLKETDLGLQYGRKEEILRCFCQEMERLTDTVIGEYISAAENTRRKQDYNRLGIAYARFRRHTRAEKAFRQALAIDSSYLSAQINLANLLFLKGEYAAAVPRFEEALASLASEGQGESLKALMVLINLSRTLYQLEDYEEAKSCLARARLIDEEETEKYAYLAQSAVSGTRAADERDPSREIIFVGEEE